MSDREYTLSDLAALEIDGPTIIFLRPREPIPHEYESNAVRWCEMASKALAHLHVRFIFMPPGMDTMALGEAQLEQLGYMRVPTGDDAIITGITP